MTDRRNISPTTDRAQLNVWIPQGQWPELEAALAQLRVRRVQQGRPYNTSAICREAVLLLAEREGTDAA